MPEHRIIVGDALDELRKLDDWSVDALVCDPPSGIFFMGKSWDGDKGGRDAWIAWLAEIMVEALRVMKPGAHGLVWALPRTSHWTATALEDAGFEIREKFSHIFGSGFPKNTAIDKQIDRIERGEMVRRKLIYFAEKKGVGGLWLEAQGIASASSFNDWTVGGHVPSDKNWSIIKKALGVTEEEEKAYEREVIARGQSGKTAIWNDGGTEYGHDITAPATEAAKQWQGWGSALKPAVEDWWLIRKPLSEPTIARNVLEHGTGGLNIDGARIGVDDDDSNHRRESVRNTGMGYSGAAPSEKPPNFQKGRFPSHLLLTHAPACAPDACAESCPVRILGEQSGESVSTGGQASLGAFRNGKVYGSGRDEVESRDPGKGDIGTAARFFKTFDAEPMFRYTPKASSAERWGFWSCGCIQKPMPAKTIASRLDRLEKDPDDRPICDGCSEIVEIEEHPTTKSIALMQYLVKLITPPGGTVLDCFMGSGSTGVAATSLGFDFIGIEMEAEYVDIARARMAHGACEIRLPEKDETEPPLGGEQLEFLS